MGLKRNRGLDSQGLESYYGKAERPYRPTTRSARRALTPEEEDIIRNGSERVKKMIAANEEWADTVD
jgi:hypothetical protein